MTKYHSINNFLDALKDAVSEERYPLALEQIKMARRELDETRRRALEFASDSGKRLGLLNKWFGDFLTREVKNTLALLAEARALDALDDVRGNEGKEAITITTTRPLAQSLKEWFMQELEAAFGSARAIFKTDASLIGGVKIRAGDREVDNSLKARLMKIVL